MRDVFMGIDVGKQFCEICVIDDSRDPVYCERISTLDENAWHETLKLFEGCNIHSAFEVGTHYEWMYDLLKKYCSRVDVVNPESFALISRSQKKTDKIDALKLAEGAWRNDLPIVFVPEKEIRRDRRLVAHIHKLSQSMCRLKAQIRNILFMARLTCPYTQLTGVKARKWIENTALPALAEQEHFLLKQLIAQLDLLSMQEKEVLQMARERVKGYEGADIAQSIPGFGGLVTLAVLSAIGKIGRFEEPGALANYFGLCGRVDQSGSVLIQGRITKRGNKHVRWLLGQAVSHVIRRDPKARAKYLKLRRKKRPKVARVALMRWVTTVLWRMLMQNERYRLSGTAGKYFVRKVYIKKAA